MFLYFSRIHCRRKGDERILGDSDFVENVHMSASEAIEGKYELKTRGYDFNRVISGLAESMGMPPKKVTAFRKSPQTVKARTLLCYCALRKVGMTATDVTIHRVVSV